MLEFYFENRVKLQQLRRCPIGSTLDGFARWMKSAGYKHRPGQLSLRAAAHVGYWLSAHEASIANLDDAHVDLFLGHLPACTCSHPFRGRDRYHAEGARQFHSYLHAASIAPPSIRVVPPPSVPVVDQFCDWMRLHRGVTESTLANYLPLVREFLAALGDAAGSYDAGQVRDFIFAGSNEWRSSCAVYRERGADVSTFSRCLRPLFRRPGRRRASDCQMAIGCTATLYRCRQYRAAHCHV